MLGILFNLPSGSDFIAAVGTTSQPLIDQLFPLAEFAVGILLAFFVIYFLVDLFTHRGR